MWCIVTHYHLTSFIHDVMHDVMVVTCVVRMRSVASTACCAVLSWLLTVGGSMFRICCFSDVAVDTSPSGC